jgi:hypothetical protein
MTDWICTCVETYWYHGVLWERALFRSCEADGRKGRQWMKMEQKTKLYNAGQWACGTYVERRNLDTGETKREFLSLKNRPAIFSLSVGDVVNR